MTKVQMFASDVAFCAPSVSFWVIMYIFVIAVDGEKLVMKGAHLTCREMLSAFQSRCTDKDPQAKAAAKWSASRVNVFICVSEMYSKNNILHFYMLFRVASFVRVSVVWECSYTMWLFFFFSNKNGSSTRTLCNKKPLTRRAAVQFGTKVCMHSY